VKELTGFKALNSPPKQVAALGITIMILKPTGTEDEKEGWEGVRRMIANPASFLVTLKSFGDRIGKVGKRQIETVLERINNPENEFHRMQEISKSAYNLLLWLKAMVKLYQVNKEVEPLKQQVEAMTKKAEKMAKELDETNKLLDGLNKQLQEANENRVKKQARLDFLTDQANTMIRRLNAAEKLLKGLAREELRWSQDEKNLLVKVNNLTGDCLTTSSFLSYAGPFDYTFRKRMVYEHWREDIIKRNIPFSEKFRIEDLLTSDVEVAQWASE
jgi:dynein heavy chain